jgi:hypothetical protein
MAQDDWDGFGVVEPDAFSWSLKTPEFGKSAGRTADPSASLGMTKGSAVLSGETGLWMRGTAGPSAPVGMTILFVRLGFVTEDSGSPRGAPRIPRLRSG